MPSENGNFLAKWPTKKKSSNLKNFKTQWKYSPLQAKHVLTVFHFSHFLCFKTPFTFYKKNAKKCQCKNVLNLLNKAIQKQWQIKKPLVKVVLRIRYCKQFFFIIDLSCIICYNELVEYQQNGGKQHLSQTLMPHCNILMHDSSIIRFFCLQYLMWRTTFTKDFFYFSLFLNTFI